MPDPTAQRRYNEWLIEQIAYSIIGRAEFDGLDEAIKDARRRNDRAEYVFDGPLRFVGPIEPHEQDSYTRYEGCSLGAEDLERTIARARGNAGEIR